MGDTTLAGTGGGAHVVEECITHGPENAVHRRLPARLAGDHRAVRALRHLSQDRLQVDRALPAPRAGRPGGALAPAAALAESGGGGDRNGDPRLPLSTDCDRWLQPVSLGCQALSSTAVDTAKPVFTRLFQEYGLPTRIRT